LSFLTINAATLSDADLFASTVRVSVALFVLLFEILGVIQFGTFCVLHVADQFADKDAVTVPPSDFTSQYVGVTLLDGLLPLCDTEI
jgi:hypothetical protein